MDRIYLDHNASAPLDPAVLEAMRPHLLAPGNPDSRHALGRLARRALVAAAETVARVLNGHPDEVVFTSGGTESNNLALFGLADPDKGPGHVVAGPVEHPAVAEPLSRLERRGFLVDRPPVGPDGIVDLSAMIELAHHRAGTRLATLILAQNETGALQPVGELSEAIGERGIPIHTDAVQAVGRIPVDFQALGVDTLAASAHKFGGPVGVGFLLVRKGIRLAPHTFGGAQQKGRRPGTVPVALAVGLAAALERWQGERDERIARWRRLRDRLEAGLVAALGRARRSSATARPTRRGACLRPSTSASPAWTATPCSCRWTCSASVPRSARPAPAVRPYPRRSSARWACRRPCCARRSGSASAPGTTEAEVDEAVRRVAEAVERASATDP